VASMAYIDRLVKGIERLPDPPCTGCAWHDFCAINEVGCNHFRSYLIGGVNRKHEPWPRDAATPDIKLGGRNGI